MSILCGDHGISVKMLYLSRCFHYLCKKCYLQNKIIVASGYHSKAGVYGYRPKDGNKYKGNVKQDCVKTLTYCNFISFNRLVCYLAPTIYCIGKRKILNWTADNTFFMVG